VDATGKQNSMCRKETVSSSKLRKKGKRKRTSPL